MDKQNKTRGMDTWNRLIDIRGTGGGGGNWKRLAKEHTCIYAQPMDTDKNVVKAGDGGQVGGLSLIHISEPTRH